jgi:hypothetical protein
VQLQEIKMQEFNQQPKQKVIEKSDVAYFMPPDVDSACMKEPLVKTS